MAVRLAVAEARPALGDSAREKRWIETVYGRGYRFRGAVEARRVAETADDFYRRGRELLRQDVDEALAASRRAAELAPQSAAVKACRGNVLGLAGRFDEAEAELERARLLDPSLFDGYFLHPCVCWTRGDLERAADLLERAFAVNQRDFMAPSLLVQIYRGLGLEERRRESARRARRLAGEHLERNPDDTRALCLQAQACQALGDERMADRLVRDAARIDPDETCTLYSAACLRAVQGREDEALDLLERAAVSGFRHRAWIEHDSDLACLRGEPRFDALLASMDPGEPARTARSDRAKPGWARPEDP